MTDQQKLQAIDSLIICYGGIGGGHHMQWLLDQIVRIMCGCPLIETTDWYGENDAYRAWVADYESAGGSEDPGSYEWDKGIAP